MDGALKMCDMQMAQERNRIRAGGLNSNIKEGLKENPAAALRLQRAMHSSGHSW
jgi:hypothetical protein